MKYAVCLAGVPGRIINSVIDALRQRYSDDFVFRGAGAPLRSNSLTHYSEDEISNALRLTVDAVFGKSKRPHGFCRNPGAPCALKNSGRHSCGKDTDQACFLARPNFTIVIAQQGENQQKLLESFQHSVLFATIHREAYDKRERTVAACVEILEGSKGLIGTIKQNMNSPKSPLFLPPLNYRSKELSRLFAKCHANGCKRESAQFRKEKYSTADSGYHGRNNTIFPPANAEIRHGIPDLTEDESVSLSSHFRLGCEYPPNYQYDVRLSNNKNFDGSVSFY